MNKKQTHITHHDRGALCRDILGELKPWFGLPESVDDYAHRVEDLPTFVACHEGRRVGFLSLLFHGAATAEVFVMGIKPDHHRSGMGRALIEEASTYARDRGATFLTVKTLDPTRESEEYRRTRQFYEAMGFLKIETFPTLWDPANPCLFMAKHLAAPPLSADERLLMCLPVLQRWLGDGCSLLDIREFAQKILFGPKDIWGCYRASTIYPEEGANKLLAELQTWRRPIPPTDSAPTEHLLKHLFCD